MSSTADSGADNPVIAEHADARRLTQTLPENQPLTTIPVICGPTAADDSIQALTGRTPQTLSNGTLTVNYSTAGTLVNRMPPSFPVVDPRDPDIVPAKPLT